jgi:hypothetical protein
VSADLIVNLQRSAMPTLAGWQQAIRDVDFPVELDIDDFDPDTFSGFLPCKLHGTESGFEYFAEPMSPAEAKEVGAPAGADFSVNLNTHSDLRDFACSAVAAGVLAWHSKGQLVNPQSGQSFEAEAAVRWAAQQLAHLATKPSFISRLVRNFLGLS